MDLAIILVSGAIFMLAQLVYYVTSTPYPRPVPTSRLDRYIAYCLYTLAYLLSLLRLPFAILPYLLKLTSVVIFHKHYRVSYYNEGIEVLRIIGEIIQWVVLTAIFRLLGDAPPILQGVLYASVWAEFVRLFAEKGQMIVSAGWQTLPHTSFARHSFIRKYLPRYARYYVLSDAERIAYIMDILRCYASNAAEASTKLQYLSTLRIVPDAQGMRGGHVRDVARGEVFIHRRWTADPWLLIGQALRRTPWFFDPRFLRRPFYYRSQSNRLATLFVLEHWHYSPSYALYQWGHEIKAARYDLFYRLLRRVRIDIEPKVQRDGSYPFDQGITWLRARMGGHPMPAADPLWDDQQVLQAIRQRIHHGEHLSALDIAEQYTYPLLYVEEILLPKLPHL